MNDNDMNEMFNKAKEMLANNQVPDEFKSIVSNFQKSNSNNNYNQNPKQANNNQKNYNELYKKIAMMSQIYNIYFGYTVYDTVMMGRYLNFKDRLLSLPSKEDKDFVLHCLEKLKILHLKDKLITEISGGELQRVFLARIFAKEPDIIILDEPTNHLDLNIQLDLINDLKQWVLENENRCIVAVLHDLNSALYFANKILILKDSSLYYYGLVRDFDINLIDKLYDADISKYMHDFLNIWN